MPHAQFLGMFGLLISLLVGCQRPSLLNKPIPEITKADTLILGIDSTQILSRKGKLKYQPNLDNIYTQVPINTVDFPIVNDELLNTLDYQARLLQLRKQRYHQKIGDLKINLTQLEETINILKEWQYTVPIGLERDLEAFQLRGRDKRGNVKFTGYFAPVIKVNSRKTKKYPYPIRSRPVGWEGPYPDRAAIEQGALDSVTVPLAYASSKVDIYYMQLQGSGYAEYPNGKRELMAFNGDNNHSYRSIEQFLADNDEAFGIKNVSMTGVKRYLEQHPQLLDSVLNVNPSFVFFKPSKSLPIGAGHVPLTPEYSIAVDPRYIPLGSCFLAAIPVIEKDKVVGHDYKVLVAQDVGGAIRGSGHVDFYFGIGKEAQKKAQNFNYYGRLWLLLPKDKPDQKDDLIVTRI